MVYLLKNRGYMHSASLTPPLPEKSAPEPALRRLPTSRGWSRVCDRPAPRVTAISSLPSSAISSLRPPVMTVTSAMFMLCSAIAYSLSSLLSPSIPRSNGITCQHRCGHIVKTSGNTYRIERFNAYLRFPGAFRRHSLRQGRDAA